MLKNMLCAVAVMLVPVLALALEAPQHRVLLTVTGTIGAENAESAAVFDRPMLEQLDWQEIETYTSFTQGLQVFSGPTLASLLEAVQATGSTLVATAINDYSVSLPVEHASLHNVILAMDHNGKPMRVRDKGPIWVVYPLNEDQAHQMLFDTEMIWQLDRIEVRQ